jgi:hypothetical protein
MEILQLLCSRRYCPANIPQLVIPLNLAPSLSLPCRTQLSSLSKSIATDCQSVSKSWCRASSGAHDHIFITVWHLRSFLWGPLCDERTSLSFVYAAGPCQRSLSRVRVPLDSRLYFTISVLRLPFSSPPTTRRVTVEVFEPTSPDVQVITFRHGPHRKHPSSVVACVLVAAGSCLPSCCPESGCVIPFIKNLLP